MSQVAPNALFVKQNGKLIKATFKKAFINAIHVGSRTVDVSFADNPQTIIRNIPVAQSVDLTTTMINQRCRVDLFDESNPNDCVVAFVY